MWKRSLFIAIICASFYLGVCGAQLLAGTNNCAWASCQGPTTCPTWSCEYSGGSGTCVTCDGGVYTTCDPGSCGICQTSYFSPCCRQNNSCPGQDLLTGPPYDGCSCGAMTYPSNCTKAIGFPFCQRKTAIWTLFASW
jgi:hypothetical protein